MSNEKTEESPPSPEVHFEPVIRLPEVEIKTLEEEEDVLLKLRAKLYRYCNEKPAEWKERGTGDVKLLHHKDKGTVRLVMRRDKTFKICANHYVTPWMELKPNCGSDKAWVWSVPADFADEEPKSELLAIKFGSAENAQKFYEKFEESKKIVLMTGNEDFVKKLSELVVKENSESEDEDADSSVDKTKAEDDGSDGSKREEKVETAKSISKESEPEVEATVKEEEAVG